MVGIMVECKKSPSLLAHIEEKMADID